MYSYYNIVAAAPASLGRPPLPSVWDDAILRVREV